MGRFSFDIGLRALDALQLAVGAEMVALGLVDELVTADRALADVAGRMGLRVVVPD